MVTYLTSNNIFVRGRKNPIITQVLNVSLKNVTIYVFTYSKNFDPWSFGHSSKGLFFHTLVLMFGYKYYWI
jgi:hypothetical protein